MLSVGRIYAGGGESGLETDDKATAGGKRRVGGGWRYLWEQVSNGAEDYYSADVARGETAGRWAGSAAEPELGLAGEVTETQMQRVFGLLVHPTEPVPLGNAPRQYRSVAQRLEAAKAVHDKGWMGEWAARESELVAAGADPEAVASELDGRREEAARRWAEVEAGIRRGGERAAVAGFDLTFSPPKSVSVLWAAADAEGRAAIWKAHREGVTAALGYVEREAAWSRTGFNGVRQVATTGMVVASFDHRMSRHGDVQIHTHNAVLNRARCDDGQWRTLDGTAVYAVAASAGALYDRVREAALERHLGVRHEQRKADGPREIVGVDDDVCRLFSSRRVAIEGRLADMVAAYRQRHGFEPSQWTIAQMSQWATLETRTAKHGTETTLEALARWEAESRAQLRRSLAEVWARAVNPDRPQVDEERPGDEEVLARAIATVDTEQATWTRYDLARQLTLTLAVDADTAPSDLLARVDALVERAIGSEAGRVGVVDLSPPAAFATPPRLRRSADGQSVFEQHGARRYTTDEGLAAEMRVLDAARRVDGPRVDVDQVDALLAAGGDGLGADQARAARQVVTSGRPLEALVGPAGTGKTHTMGAVARIWEAAGGDVIGLAVAETAARILAAEAGIHTVNTAKLLFEHHHRPDQERAKPAWQAQYGIAAGALVILDEAGMASRQVIDEVARLCDAAGAKLLLVGDHEQLASPDAGGTFALVVDHIGAARLEEVRRFAAEWERDASLRLRDGDVDVLGEYDLRARVSGGTESEMEDAAFRAAAADRARGARTFLLADTNEQAARLAGRTRDQLVAAGTVDDATIVNLDDGNRVGVGDRIVTRRNDRTNTAGGRFVANRDVWQVTAVHDDRAISAARVDPDRDQLNPEHQLRLGGDYVAADVQLEYAGTVHSGQGGNRSVSHAIITPTTSRQALYVALSRGRDDNRAYVVTSQPEGADLDGTAQDPLAVLAAIIERDEQPSQVAAVATRQRLAEQQRSLATLFPIWQDLVTAASRARWQAAVAAAAGAETAAAMVTSEAWPTLAARLRIIDTAGVDSASALAAAAAARTLAGSDDVAAVPHWRLRHTETALAATATPDTFAEISPPGADEYRSMIAEVAAAMDARSAELGQRVADNPPAWAAELGPQPDEGDGDAGAEWRRRAGVVAGYREAFALEDAERLERHDGDQPAADPIGCSPPPGRPDAAGWWRRAATALNRSHPATLADLPDEHLEAIVDQARRAEAAAPAPVEAQLRELSAELRKQRTAHGEAITAAHPAAEETARSVEVLEAKVADLERSRLRRQQWRAANTELHSRAAAAAAELAARAAARASRPHWDMNLDALRSAVADVAEQLGAAQQVVQRRRNQAARWQENVDELRAQLAELTDRRPETTAAEAVVAAEAKAAARIDNLRRSLAETRHGRLAGLSGLSSGGGDRAGRSFLKMGL